MELNQFRDVDIVLDKANDNIIQKQFVSAGDKDGRSLTVQITENGAVGEVIGLTLNLRWHNEASGLTDLSAFYVVDRATSVFKIDYPQNMLTPGKVVAYIQILHGGKVTHTKPFEITVQNLAGTTRGVLATAEYGALVTTLAKANEFETDIAEVTAQLAHKATKGQITSQDLSTSTDASKIQLINLSEEVQSAIAGTAPVISTVENGSLTNEKYAIESISQRKLNFTPLVGREFKNLFNKETVTKGSYVSYNTGEILANLVYSVSEWISVEPNTQYTREKADHLAFYTASKTYISGVLSQSFTTPSNCFWVRISVAINDLNAAQLELGSSPTPYEEYGSSPINLKLENDYIKKRHLEQTIKNEFLTQLRYGKDPAYSEVEPYTQKPVNLGTTTIEWLPNENVFDEGHYYLKIIKGDTHITGLSLKEKIPEGVVGDTSKSIRVTITYTSTEDFNIDVYQRTKNDTAWTNPLTFVTIPCPNTYGEEKTVDGIVPVLSDGYYTALLIGGLQATLTGVGSIAQIGSIKYSVVGVSELTENDDEDVETIITVALDGTGDYTTIKEAIDYANTNASEKNKVIIQLDKETYNEGLLNILSDNVVLQGKGMEETIIRCDGNTIRPDLGRHQKHGLSTMGDIVVNDLTIDVNDVKYPVHNDASTGVGSRTKPFKAVFNRCILRHRGCVDNSYYNAIGEGLYGGQFTSYNDCIFEYTGNEISSGAYALFWHNWNNQSKKCGTTINNGKCYGYEIANISELGSDNTDVVEIRNTTSDVANARIKLSALKEFYRPEPTNATEVPYNIQLVLEGTYNTVIDRTSRPLNYQYM